MHTEEPDRLDAELDESEHRRLIEFVLASLNQSHRERVVMADRSDVGAAVRGYDHDGPFDFDSFLAAMATTGFQATNLARAVEILRQVRDRDIPLYLGFTSNIGTCGLRETITYLTRNQYVRTLATTAGAVEEDVMKIFRPFLLGSFAADGKDLYDRMINRTGNIFIPSGRYTRLHMLLFLLNKRLARERATRGSCVGISEYTHELGRQLELLEVPGRETSFVYWAYRHRIPLHCPVLLDGAIGDGMYYFRRESKHRFAIDATEYADALINDMIVSSQRRGAVALLAIGGSVPKHMICNAAIFAGGASYAVYVNNSPESDGSNAGAPIDEAVTWGKIRPGAQAVKVEGEATLVVPLLVAGAYQQYVPRPQAVATGADTFDGVKPDAVEPVPTASS
jgi:deoxyhypusine synthase